MVMWVRDVGLGAVKWLVKVSWLVIRGTLLIQSNKPTAQECSKETLEIFKGRQCIPSYKYIFIYIYIYIC